MRRRTSEPPRSAFTRWWTQVEWAIDDDTGAYAQIEDRKGIWAWGVRDTDGIHTVRGSSKTQKGARAACRRVVRRWAKEKSQ